MSNLPLKSSSPTAAQWRMSSEQRTPHNKPPTHYTVVVRLPFRRDDFRDPPPVDWDSTKDKALWKLISRSSNARDMNWGEIATRFDVELVFLLQQAAWLYERHFAGMKAQMRKVNTAPTSVAANASPTPPTPVVENTTAEIDTTRDPSSAAAQKRDVPSIAAGAEPGSSPGTPKAAQLPGISRTPSTTTVTQSRVSTHHRQRVLRGSNASSRRPAPPTRPVEDRAQENDYVDDDDDDDDDSDSQSSDSHSNEGTVSMYGKGKATRRPPTLGRAGRTMSSEADDEEDEDDSSGGGYLPFAAASKIPAVISSREDPAATLRGSPARPYTATSSKRDSTTPTKDRARHEPIESSASSVSSAAQHPPDVTLDRLSLASPRPGPLSPAQKAKLGELTPRSKKSGSDGTPSMGSSFSDLDNESVTQSALEEALMSNAGGASIASRMSSIGGAWKTKKR